MRRITCSLLLLASVSAHASSAGATPAQIVILRHGEKQDAYRLCDVGVQRSLALAAQYLGKGAKIRCSRADVRPRPSSRSRCTRSSW